MSEELTIEVSKQQREVLLRGLRFVRSSLMLTPQEPTADSVAERESELQGVRQLVEQLSGSPAASKVS